MKNPHLRRFALPLLAAALSVTGNSALAQSGLPAAIREQMDAASARFTSAQADIRQELFTKVVQDTEIQTGEIYFERKAGSTEMGMKLLPPGAAPGAQPSQVISFKAGKLQMFNPGTNQIDEFSATGKNQQLAETLLTLGFGASGAALAKAWTITDQGSVPMKEGDKTVQTEQLDLVSKDPSITNYYSRITIWLDPARDVTLKQLFYQASNGKPTGDTRTAYFSNIRLNQPIDTAAFAIKCKGKCTVVQH